MNSNSYLCKFISEHPDDWEQRLLRDYHVKVKKDGCYAIFNYSFDCVYSEPIVQESRGIIIDYERLRVVCWPFRKFGNHNESYADEIDWSTARVLEKVDGSIIKLWYDGIREEWQFSTNGMIRAESALVEGYLGVSFFDVIRRADNYCDIPFERLDKAKTYIFELVSPETQIVVDYGETMLYHIGTRSNISGKESEEDIGIRKPASYPITSLDECIKAALALNEDGATEEIEREGFVVVDANYNRVKVKSPSYIMMNKLMQMRSISKRECIEMLTSGSEDVKVICEANPALLPTFKYYEYRLAELTYNADRICLLARSLYKEYDGDRGAVAKVVAAHKLGGIAFRSIDTGKGGAELVRELPIERLVRLIPDYEPYDMGRLFLEERDDPRRKMNGD